MTPSKVVLVAFPTVSEVSLMTLLPSASVEESEPIVCAPMRSSVPPFEMVTGVFEGSAAAAPVPNHLLLR